ncbi:hypothetical protein [Dactylosporangium sp. NPDC050588]|uniref:hypothetical protein n=1 Tax=Dactylosporangium sp. NPDC050588 TaxID=3157211 RepID=UPI0033CA93DC
MDRRQPRHTPVDAPGDDEATWVRPDFAALYGVDPEFTPRTASALYTGLCLVTDGIALDTDDHGSEPVISADTGSWRVLDQLPHATWRQPEAWRRHAAAHGRLLIQQLETGGGLAADCVIDYLILHLAVDRAEEEVDDALFDPSHPSHGLPTHLDDYAWDLLPYSTPLGDPPTASMTIDVSVADLHKAYLALRASPDRWFERMTVATNGKRSLISVVRDADEQQGLPGPARPHGTPSEDPPR